MVRSTIKKFIPPILLELARAKRQLRQPQELWRGEFNTWKDAESLSGGYNEGQILNACSNALIKVKTGDAVYERDSVLFDKVQYSWPLLACLENVAIENKGNLHLIDFGGSLGSSYFQNRHFLNKLGSLKWIVVEQENFVSVGRSKFMDETLQFQFSIDDAIKEERIHCLLLSGVLQYLPDPYAWIANFLNYRFDYIIIDRTGFVDRPEDMLTIQHVPPEIYEASYPCWFFSEEVFKKKFAADYAVIADFNDSFTAPVLLNGSNCYWRGFYLKRNK
jgi:putative methyltransferase (TIGR04325 family)